MGAIAEMVGALGVIATLGYLAVQIRQSSRVVGTSNYMQMTSQMSEFSNQLAADAELYEIYQRGIVSYLDLDEVERGRFHMLLSGLFTKYQVMIQLERRGQLDGGLYDEMFAGIFELLALSGIREWWSAERRWFAVSFRQWVDARLEGTDG
jgi:hypothetical protein